MLVAGVEIIGLGLREIDRYGIDCHESPSRAEAICNQLRGATR
jgi:hypothetical protein